MQKIMKAARVSLTYLAALLLVSSYPLSAMAQTAETTQAAPVSETVAVSQPLASEPEAVSTTDSSSASTEAAPPTSEEPAKPKETYTYNTETSHWDSNRWQYNPESGKYERPPESATSDPVIVDPAKAESTSDTTAAIDSETNSAIANAIHSDAVSGDATVEENTTAGSATSGDASSAATIINNVNSTVSNAENQKAATFISDVVGDVSGDIILQPMLLKAMLEAGAQHSIDGSINITNTNQLTNDITLNAESGDATVRGNTSAGDATTGDANTVASVLNIVNSMVSANQSFVGTINIYGNLDGDILVAPDFIPQMIANNGETTPSTSTTVSSKDTQSIVNNIALAAESGQAVVSGNTSAGDATTGDANTNIVLFNLSGHEIVASNSLLVFVNVLGKWVGVIVDAPTGATAAAIGNGVTTNSVNAPDLVIDMESDTQITNNINLSSISGNATVTGNTRAGNATTGNATASANVGNIVGTSMGLSDWFGVLFINVFGSWNGSFGIDTAAGNHVAAGGKGEQSTNETPPRVIEFMPRSNSESQRTSKAPAMTIISNNGHGGSYEATTQPAAQTTSAAQEEASTEEAPSLISALSHTGTPSESSLPWLSGAIFLGGLSLVGTSMLSDARKRSADLEQR